MNLCVNSIFWHTSVSFILIDQLFWFDCNKFNEFLWSYCTAALTDQLWFFLTYRLTDLVMSNLFMSILTIQLNYYVKILLLIIFNFWLSFYKLSCDSHLWQFISQNFHDVNAFFNKCRSIMISCYITVLLSSMLLVYSLYIICLSHILADWSQSLAISICHYSFHLLSYATTHHSLLLLDDFQNISTDWSQSLIIQSIHFLDVWHHSFCYYWSVVLYYYLLCYIVLCYHLSVFGNTENMMREIRRR